MLPDLVAVRALETRLATREPTGDARRPVHLRQAVQLESVSFRYEEGAEPALVSVDLTIAAGQTTAIVDRRAPVRAPSPTSCWD